VKILAIEKLVFFVNFVYASHNNLVVSVRSCKHKRGFAIISFLRKITKIKENYMSNSALLEATKEIKEINEVLSQKSSFSKKMLFSSKKELVHIRVEFSRHIDSAIKFIKKTKKQFNDQHLEELLYLLATLREGIDTIYRNQEWEEIDVVTDVVKKSDLFLLNKLKKLEFVINDALQSKSNDICGVDIKDNEIEDEFDPSMWIDNSLLSQSITVSSSFKQVGYYIPCPLDIDDDIED